MLVRGDAELARDVQARALVRDGVSAAQAPRGTVSDGATTQRLAAGAAAGLRKVCSALHNLQHKSHTTMKRAVLIALALVASAGAQCSTNSAVSSFNVT